MNSFLNLRLCVYSIPVIFSLLFSWINCEDVQHFDDDWEERFRRWTPFPWNKYTVPTMPTRDDYYYRKSSTDDTTLKLAIFLPLGFALFLVMIFKMFVCNDNNACCGDSSTSTSHRTVHAPPRRLNTPTNTRQFRTPSMTVSREELLRSLSNNGTSPNRSSGINGGGNSNASRTNNVTAPSSDRPPDYSVVVISDLSQTDKFPGVKLAQYPDTSPPKYDEMNLPKY